MPSTAFVKARAKGQTAEDYVAYMFRSWGLAVAQTPKGYHPEYDMIVQGKFYGDYVRFKAEVKYDKKSAQSGNIYLDIQSLKKSHATILIIYLNDPIDTVLIMPLQNALDYAVTHCNAYGGEFSEPSCLVSYQEFLRAVKPKLLTTK